MKTSCIYKITSPTGKIYVGQTRNMYMREIAYRKLHCKKQKKLFASIMKYGFENHTLEIIEECERENLNSQEIYWISFYDSYNNGLNLTTGGDNYERSIETREAISESKKGDKNYMYGRKGVLHHNYGAKASQETIQKLKSSHLGKGKGKNNANYKGDIYAYKDNNIIGVFQSSNEAAETLNLIARNIRAVILGKRNHCGGYIFKRESIK